MRIRILMRSEEPGTTWCHYPRPSLCRRLTSLCSFFRSALASVGCSETRVVLGRRELQSGIPIQAIQRMVDEFGHA